MFAPPVPDLPSLRRALAAAPDDRTARLVLADALDADDQTDPRAAVLRAAVAIHEAIGKISFPDRLDTFWAESPGWEAVGRRLEALAAHPEDTDAFRRRSERLIRGDVPLDPEDLGATLRLQYDLQVRLLASLNLLDATGGITGIDGKHYPLPVFDDVLARLDEPGLRRKLSQAFDTLLLVPFGLPLDRLLDAWRDGLRRNAATLRSVGQFNQAEPLYVWDEYRTQPLVYDLHAFSVQHGGRTKDQLLAEGRRGFDVLLVEGAIPDLPRPGEARTVGGRRQLARGRSPNEYLRDLPDDEVGLTPEAYVLHFLDTLERCGQVLDHQSTSYLLGAYLPASSYIPDACWSAEHDGQACLNAFGPGARSDFGGARAAVRVA